MRLTGVVGAVLMFVGAATAFAAEDAKSALQKLIDRAEIEELITRYVTALDTLDADAYEGVFTRGRRIRRDGQRL